MNTSDLFRKKSISRVLAEAAAGEGEAESLSLAKSLTARDLAAFGIAAIVGAGVFSTIGTASADGGPGVILLFLFTAVACSFTGFAYAEFASMVPVAGSAYTYSYVAFGELVAWIIGWALIMEYAVGNATVAVSWSDYLSALLASMHMHIPAWASIDYVSAGRGFEQVSAALADGQALGSLDRRAQTAFAAWSSAPQIGNFRLILDAPAVLITIAVTALAYIGMKESRNANNVMVGIKLVVIVLVIAVGIFNINTENWTPFMPEGIGGVLKGVSAVFFAYIGFDAISTTAEECKNPERDLPRGIMWAIVISTVLYVLLALVLTGMVHYDLLRVGDPLSFVFEKIGMKWFSAIIAVSAVVAMTSVLLVFQIGQPRIWLAMSRDGLLPKKFATVHPKFRTPSYATVMTAIVVIVATLFIPTDEVINLCSMGTLVAFVLVCGGVLRLQNDPARPKGRFRTPYINGKYILPALLVTLSILFATLWRARLQEYLDFQSWSRDQDKVPVYLFIGVFVYLAVVTYRRNLSLIPALGLLTSFYMMAHVPMSSWLGFFVWLVIGLAIYFSFGIRNSKLARAGRRKAQDA